MAKVRTESQHGLSFNPIGILLAALAAVALWLLNPFSPTLLILAVIIILMFLGLNRPVWAMAALFVSQFSLTSYYVDIPVGLTLSLRLVILIIIGLILFLTYRRGRYTPGSQIRSLILPCLILVVITAISDFINAGFATTFKDLRDLATGIMIIIFTPMVVKNPADLKVLGGIAFIVITGSAIVGVMQHYNILGMQSVTLLPKSLSDGRIPGIAESTLELSYVLSSAIVVLVSLVLTRSLPANTRLVILLSVLIMAATIYFTYTRSALMAAGFGVMALFILLKTPLKGELVLLILLLVSGFLVITPLGGGSVAGRSESSQEDSTVARQILWQAGFNIAMDHPVLGIGSDNFGEVSSQYQSSVDNSLLAYEKREYWGYRTLGNQPVHNDYLNVWVSHGTLAFIALLWIFIIIMRNYMTASRISSNSFLKGLAVGLAAALVSYGVNAFYHNVLGSLSLFWMLGGLSLAVLKLAVRSPGINSGYNLK